MAEAGENYNSPDGAASVAAAWAGNDECCGFVNSSLRGVRRRTAGGQ